MCIKKFQYQSWRWKYIFIYQLKSTISERESFFDIMKQHLYKFFFNISLQQILGNLWSYINSSQWYQRASLTWYTKSFLLMFKARFGQLVGLEHLPVWSCGIRAPSAETCKASCWWAGTQEAGCRTLHDLTRHTQHHTPGQLYSLQGHTLHSPLQDNLTTHEHNTTQPLHSPGSFNLGAAMWLCMPRRRSVFAQRS